MGANREADPHIELVAHERAALAAGIAQAGHVPSIGRARQPVGTEAGVDPQRRHGRQFDTQLGRLEVFPLDVVAGRERSREAEQPFEALA
jgi:hypothetical protein